MLLGALVDVGLPLSELTRGLKAVELSGYTLRATTVRRGGMPATKVDVNIRRGMGAPLELRRIQQLIASSRLASNRLIDIEDLSEDELNTLEKYYSELVRMSKKDKSMHQSHSIEEASELHEMKVRDKKNLGDEK